MRSIPRSLCVCAATLCLLALGGGGLAWGLVRVEGAMTERALRAFVREVLARSREQHWAEVRSAASRDALDGLERHRSEWGREADIEARSLGSGAWALWIETRSGARYQLRVDDLTWRPLAFPWRQRVFRLASFEKLG